MNPSNIALRYILTLLVVISCLTTGSEAQKSSFRYPLWFLNQGELRCGLCAIGYAPVSIYPDSAFTQAYQNALVNLAFSRGVKITGSQGFWSTEAGTAWMGNDFTESVDTQAVNKSGSESVVLEKYANSNITLVLAGVTDLEVPEQLRSDITVGKSVPPSWTEKLPVDSKFLYAVGVAPEYFYEMSSWLEAENGARRNLARSLYVRMNSMQKYSKGEDQEVRTEEISFTLRNAEITARWRDVDKKIFYVLIKYRLLDE